jgi:hypothetical protein
MFKPRSAAASATPPSVELVRQRANHRLVGVSLLVLAGVVLFPLLFFSGAFFAIVIQNFNAIFLKHFI